MENEIKFYRMKDGEFVERIRIDKKYEIAKKVVKFQKEKIEIKPYINTKDAVEILNIVLDNYYNEEVETNLISSSKILYSYFLAVCKVMTNVETEQHNSVDYLVDSGFEECLKENIKNYKEVLDSVYFTIEQKNNYDREKDFENFVNDSINEIKKILNESSEGLNDSSKDLIKSINELNELQTKGLPKEDKIKKNTKKK